MALYIVINFLTALCHLIAIIALLIVIAIFRVNIEIVLHVKIRFTFLIIPFWTDFILKLLLLLCELLQINLSCIEDHRYWTVITAPVFRMNLAFLDCMHGLVAYHHIVKTPSLVFFATLVSDIPECVLNFTGIQLSKRVCKTHPNKVGEALPFCRCEARHCFITLGVVNVYVLMSYI